MQKEIIKLDISAVVVSCNEGHLLKQCLSSLQFCNEVILIDLQSDDNSIEIGEKLTHRIHSRARAPYVEKQQHWIADKTTYDWILYIDADEVVDEKLAFQIVQMFNNGFDNNIGQFSLPWQFYFKAKALKGTVWGGENYKNILIDRRKVKVQDISQKKTKLLEGYITYKIPFEKSNVIHHYWMISFKALLEKHKRYIRIENKDDYQNGKRYSVKRQLSGTIKAFTFSFFTKRGYLDGLTGLFLSFFYSWYIFMKWKSLFNYQRTLHTK